MQLTKLIYIYANCNRQTKLKTNYHLTSLIEIKRLIVKLATLCGYDCVIYVYVYNMCVLPEDDDKEPRARAQGKPPKSR